LSAFSAFPLVQVYRLREPLAALTICRRAAARRLTIFVDSLSWIHGTHTFKFGGDYKFFMFDYSDPSYYQARGTFTFSTDQYSGNAMADFLLGGIRSDGRSGWRAASQHSRPIGCGLRPGTIGKSPAKLTVNIGPAL